MDDETLLECKRCDGTGEAASERETYSCPDCFGAGHLSVDRAISVGQRRKPRAMTPPPRDRWIVVWTVWEGMDDRPIVVRWEGGSSLYPDGFDPGFWDCVPDSAIRFPDREIAAWAECPARPE